ncbi:hypothetical protein [uncultured Roseobacter sp.]|uniref:hypothetical protein n=1 Tax=uncultured Roseobacter sp. TaxID=114847 RepID=UPI0026236A94|nr:hypothetical protein [uncultured Roseobacter sp.]
MSSFSSDGGGNDPGSIVPKFDSATQISDRDKLEFRVSMIRDEEVRRGQEVALVTARGELKKIDQKYFLAESGFVDKHLKPDQTLTLDLGGTPASYEDRVNQLKRQFTTSQEAIILQDRRAEVADQHLAAMDKAVKEILNSQDRSTEKPIIDLDKHKSRDQAPDISAAFRRVR